MSSKFNINIGSLGPDKSKEIEDAVNAGQSVKIKGGQTQSRQTIVQQTVVQSGEHCYTIENAVGLHIGETFGQND